MQDIVYLCANLLVNCFRWFFNLLDSLGYTFLWLTAIITTLAFKFILGPIFGVASSDMASSSYNSFKRRKEK